MQWFSGTPDFRDERRRPVYREWKCPVPGCTGYMQYTGQCWPTGRPGYHHKCSVCTAGYALEQVYPRMEFLVEDDK